jgi:hypothetical protein
MGSGASRGTLPGRLHIDYELLCFELARNKLRSARMGRLHLIEKMSRDPSTHEEFITSEAHRFLLKELQRDSDHNFFKIISCIFRNASAGGEKIREYLLHTVTDSVWLGSPTFISFMHASTNTRSSHHWALLMNSLIVLCLYGCVDVWMHK